MALRAELELRAAAVNVNASTIHNDSVLEHTVLKAERAMTAKAGTATTLAPSAAAKAAVSDGTTTVAT